MFMLREGRGFDVYCRKQYYVYAEQIYKTRISEKCLYYGFSREQNEFVIANSSYIFHDTQICRLRNWFGISLVNTRKSS